MAFFLASTAAFFCFCLCHVLATRPEPRLLLGLQSANLTASLAFNLHPVGKFRDRPVSLHIIIPCVGRESIFRMLDSLEPQLEAQDLLTVVFDGVDRQKVFDRVKKKLDKMPGTNEAIMEAESVNDSGNTPRNRHRTKGGDFVMFADDDNHYAADALSTIRAVVHHDFEALYIFQMQMEDNVLVPAADNGEVERGNVDSGCGVVPTKHAHLADWTDGPVYEGDAHYFHALSERLPRTYFVKKIIYIYSGAHKGGEV